MPSRFPAWTETLGAMLDHGAEIRALCTKSCGYRDIDIAALCERLGREYSLIDRRCACRITPGCKGWNRFYYLQATYRPLWTEARSTQWMLER